jgi:hypothetical protein
LVSDQNNLANPIYVIDEYIGFFIPIINEEYKEAIILIDPLEKPAKNVDGILKMFFDGEYSKEGEGSGVVLISPNKK